jgi:short-subunit dehydrogenase
MTDGELARPFAVVTGASSGIGRSLAREFARQGFDLLLTATDPHLADVAREVAEHGARVQIVAADLRTYDGVELLYRAIAEAGHPVDAIAINAGVGLGGAFVGDTDLRAELDLIALNVAATVHLAKRVLPGMVERGEGRVLFTTSIEALMPGPFEAAYAASKAFILSFSEALRNELQDSGVTVTALLPGATDTPIFHRANMDDTLVGKIPKDSPDTVARQAVAALLAGNQQIVAGSLVTKAIGAVAKVLPDAVNAGLHRQTSKPRPPRH